MDPTQLSPARLTLDAVLERFDVHLLNDPGHPFDGLWVVIDEDRGIVAASGDETLACHIRLMLVNHALNPLGGS